MNFKKVVIWGHKLHSHTHSYIHNGFYKAFEHLGYDVLWLDKTDDISHLTFENCLFIVEGQTYHGIPIQTSSKYVLHNCAPEPFSFIPENNKLILQFYNKDVLGYNIEKINLYTYRGKNSLFFPWATNLLPYQIDLEFARVNIDGDCVWVGSYHENDTSRFENHSQLKPFIELAKKFGDNFVHIDPWKNPVSDEENQRLVNQACMAPAIVSRFQKEIDYLSCRTFKNISYGTMAISNSRFANEVFDGKLVYHDDPEQLFYLALEHLNDPDGRAKIQDLMRNVQTNHTYVNRARTILESL